MLKFIKSIVLEWIVLPGRKTCVNSFPQKFRGEFCVGPINKITLRNVKISIGLAYYVT